MMMSPQEETETASERRLPGHCLMLLLGLMCMAQGLAAPRPQDMAMRGVELLYGFPIAALIITLCFSSFTGHFMAAVNEHLRLDIGGGSTKDPYLESIPVIELSEYLLDADTADEEDAGRAQLLYLVDGVLGIGSVALMMMASSSDTLSGCVYIGTFLLTTHYILHKTSYRNRSVTTTRLFMNLGVVLIGVLLAAVPTMLGNRDTSNRNLYSLAAALCFSGWLYSGLLTFTRAADSLSGGEALVCFKRLLTSCWVVSLVAISACVIAIVWVDVELEPGRIKPVMLNAATLGVGFVVCTIMLGAVSPFAQARMLVAPLCFFVLLARAQAESDPRKVVGCVFVLLAGLLFWSIIQWFGLQSRLSLLYLCVSEDTAQQMTVVQHASACFKQLCMGINTAVRTGTGGSRHALSAQKKEGSLYFQPPRRSRFLVCNRGTQLTLGEPWPEQYTPGREETVIQVRSAGEGPSNDASSSTVFSPLLTPNLLH